MTLITTFILSNLLQNESGLLTVTIMGSLLANQKKISIKHIIEFIELAKALKKLGLRVLLVDTNPDNIGNANQKMLEARVAKMLFTIQRYFLISSAQVCAQR